jgi:hypothetical protein
MAQMTDAERFLTLWIISFATFVVVATLVAGLVFISDRVIVCILRTFRLRRIYETATRIATIVETEPDEWRFEQYRATYKAIGTIDWFTDLKVVTSQGTWKPDRIERRIIRNALDRTIKAKVRERVAQAASGRAMNAIQHVLK